MFDREQCFLFWRKMSPIRRQYEKCHISADPISDCPVHFTTKKHTLKPIHLDLNLILHQKNSPLRLLQRWGTAHSIVSSIGFKFGKNCLLSWWFYC